jgi:L-threonylcarbamoyladenylate synthase
MPTETVYGLAADATAPGAVARIFEVKGRPADHPLIVHLASAGQLDSWAAEVPTLHVSWPMPPGPDR